MDIREIYKGCLYSIKFDEADTDEYSRTLSLWKDLDYLVDFFETNAQYVDQPFWREAGLDPDKPMASAERVASEAIILASHIRDLARNVESGELPDFEDFFQPLGGKYSYVRELEPHKSYGSFVPSLLRLYAIKFSKNTYLVVFGGIKLGSTIQNSPGLKEQVFNRIDNVIAFLKANGIFESDDILKITVMKFNLEKLRQLAQPLPEKERQEMEYQIENQDWLLLSVRLALKIRSLMNEAGISKSELARRMNVTPAQITKILSGQENLGLKTIAKVEAALGKPLYQIEIEEATKEVSMRQRVQYIPVFISSQPIENNLKAEYASFNLMSQTALS